MKKLLSLALLMMPICAVIQVDTSLVIDGVQHTHDPQYWYVGDHIKRSCGDVELDGTIRQIYGDDVTVHFKIKKGDELIEEKDVTVAWGNEGTLVHEQAELKIQLTDLQDQHPKKNS